MAIPGGRVSCVGSYVYNGGCMTELETMQMQNSPVGEYLAVYYDPNAQRFLLDHLDAILNEK